MRKINKKINHNNKTNTKKNYLHTIQFSSFIIIFLLLLSLISTTLYAEEIIDKQGRLVTEITKPTAETTIDPDTISSAVRHIPKASTDYTEGKYKDYEGPSKNIFSADTIYSSSEWAWTNSNWTLIRHTASITDVNEDRYELRNDIKKDRMRMKIIVAGVGEFEAKNGFYKIEDKTYYFDEDGLMVLGPAYDTIGNYYFFSYETGELVEEKPVK